MFEKVEPNWERDALVERCRSIALEAHKNQKREGGEPYFAGHLEPVAKAMRERYREHPHFECVAYLHDLFEDCPDWNGQRLIDLGVPDPVVLSVETLTHDKKAENYHGYIMRLARSEDLYALAVKVEDIGHNLRSLPTDKPNANRRERWMLALEIIGGALQREWRERQRHKERDRLPGTV